MEDPGRAELLEAILFIQRFLKALEWIAIAMVTIETRMDGLNASADSKWGIQLQ
jgi:hypothetical protein